MRVHHSRSETRDERREEARRRVREAVAELIDSDGFQRWLEVRARFHRYSLFNTFLIASQCPHATQVAGYQSWRTKFGRQVRKGERAIRILAPVTVRRRDDVTGEEVRACVGFQGACVFDVSQTEGEPIPEPPPCVPLEGDELAPYRVSLENHARELGYAVYYYAPPSGAWGFCDRDGQRIVVDDTLSPNAQVSTLVHELAHAHGLDYEGYTRTECETIVEAVTMIVLSRLGFDGSGFSVPYIARWANDHDGLDALERFTAAIDETARALETALELQ